MLLNELAETLGPDLCHQFVTPEVICLSEDPFFRVRKATALNLDMICKTASSTTVVDRLIPAFIKLSKDDIWGVRKACAESLVAVSKAVDVSIRVQVKHPLHVMVATIASSNTASTCIATSIHVMSTITTMTTTVPHR